MMSKHLPHPCPAELPICVGLSAPKGMSVSDRFGSLQPELRRVPPARLAPCMVVHRRPDSSFGPPFRLWAVHRSAHTQIGCSARKLTAAARPDRRCRSSTAGTDRAVPVSPPLVLRSPIDFDLHSPGSHPTTPPVPQAPSWVAETFTRRGFEPSLGPLLWSTPADGG
jgi:hypothetical protein